MLFFFEVFGVVVGAISGVLAADGKRVDLFGVIVLALVTALGGGTIRDMALSVPVFWIGAPLFVLTATGTAVLMFFIAHGWVMPGKLLVIADALVLASFTIMGTTKALDFGTGNVNAVVLGVITGVAGGILRDVLVGEIPMVFRKEIYLYATAAFFGATVFVLLRNWMPVAHPAPGLIGLALVLTLRLLGIQWKISLPVFKA
ncbi:MAG TPA: trimeric intracellular cation channel family protein [Planctomycetota bacterium]|jgi:uncharacterized membrane protein YeiH